MLPPSSLTPTLICLFLFEYGGCDNSIYHSPRGLPECVEECYWSYENSIFHGEHVPRNPPTLNPVDSSKLDACSNNVHLVSMKLVGRMNPCLFFALVISFFFAPVCRELHVYLSWKTYFCKESFLAIKYYWVLSGAIIGDGDRKPWDPRGPVIWDNFPIFRTNCAILTSYISANPRTCRGFSRVCCHVTWSKIVSWEF